MIGRKGGRARGWRAQPRGVRMAARRALAAAVTMIVAGGAWAALRPDAAAGPHARLRHAAGSLTAGGGTNPSTPGTAPTAPAAGSVAGSTGATVPAAVPGAGGTAPATHTTLGATPGEPPTAASGGKATAPTSAPVATPPAKTTSAAPGWSLLPQAPTGGRKGHIAVWTGREMVVWGGEGDFDSDPLTDGAAFDPAARTWRKVPAAPLSPRFDAKAAWTGREVIVFGGMSIEGDILSDGAAWDPAANRWRSLPRSPIGARDGAVVAWAGDRLVVWGGGTVPPPDAPDTVVSEMRADGSAYVPATDRWVPVAAATIPARTGAESVWTGSRLVISGGFHEGDDDDRTDGAALDPVSGAWSPVAARPAPGSCGGDTSCAGVWTGAAALFPASGLAYDPAGDRWSEIAPNPAAGPAAGEPAVWTGRFLLAWGTPSDAPGDDGAGGDGPPPAPTGAIYDPATNRWQTLPAGPLSGRDLHTAIWTGEEMLVWGGTAGDASLGDGAAFRPAE